MLCNPGTVKSALKGFGVAVAHALSMTDILTFSSIKARSDSSTGSPCTQLLFAYKRFSYLHKQLLSFVPAPDRAKLSTGLKSEIAYHLHAGMVC